MSRFSFTSLRECLATVSIFGVISLIWLFIWLGIKDDTYPDGRKRYTSFWNYWLGPENGSDVRRLMNWLTFFVGYSYTFFRLCCTIFHGYKGGA